MINEEMIDERKAISGGCALGFDAVEARGLSFDSLSDIPTSVYHSRSLEASRLMHHAAASIHFHVEHY